MKRTCLWYLPACVSLLLGACGDAILAPELDPAGPSMDVALKPVVGEVSGCSNPTWWRDANGQCWPPDPEDDGGSGGDGDGDSDDPGGGGGEGPDDPAVPPDTCKTNDEVVNSPSVQAGFDTIWAQSNYSPTTPQTERREIGGWIIQTASVYGFQQFTNVQPRPCGFEIDPAAKPANAVAWVHTHPWALEEEQTSCEGIRIGQRIFYQRYKGESSIDDDTSAGILNLPGYILDANGITKFDQTGVTLARHGRCGY